MGNNIYIIIAIILSILLIGALIAIFYLLKNNKKSEPFKDLLTQARDDYSKLEKQLREETDNVEKHQEELLAQTEHLQEMNVELERLSLVASKTDTAVIIADNNGKLVWVNKGFIKQYGYTLSEYIKAFGEDIYSITRESNLRVMLEDSIRNKRSLSYASKIKVKSGSSIWVKTLINPIFDEFQNVKQYIILETDISELKLINNQLKKLSLVASKSSNAVMIYDADKKLDWVNEGFLNMFGYSKQEYIEEFGEDFDQYCLQNNKPNAYGKLITEKESIIFVRDFSDRFGVKKWKQSMITPVFAEDGELQNVIIIDSDITRIKEVEKSIQLEKNKVDDLLLNILPEETAEELKSKGKATPRLYRNASVLFADIQDFTKLAEDLTPDELVHNLQSYFSRFDDAVGRAFVEKIKTMGDAFLCVGGIPMRNKSHPFDTVLVALELQQIMQELGLEREESGRKALKLRVGIHSGPIVAGVVGKQKMTYDIWGDSVNIAKRIESACVPGMVNVSATTYEVIKDYFECEHRGQILAKHKGHIDMYFVHRLKPEFSERGNGIIPNNYFKEMLARL